MKKQPILNILPKKDNITYAYDNKYLTIIEELENGKTREVYHIEKSRCKTIEDQFDWILHMNEKNWINGYTFKDEFAATIRLWAHGDAKFATAISLNSQRKKRND